MKSDFVKSCHAFKALSEQFVIGQIDNEYENNNELIIKY